MKKSFFAISIIVIILAIILFCFSHSTYYKYNDWWIIGNSIENVKTRYGEFEHVLGVEGSFDKKGGTVGYFIYEDNSLVMPSYLPYYYWIQYNSYGIVENVFVQTLPGG